MKQTKKIEIFEQLNAKEMTHLKGGFSIHQQAAEQEIYIYINGKRYRINKDGAISPA
ncbi:MAG: hypothetical protein Q4G63_05570 [Bacteroidia bacterium]|nr:hypothetical protein [Bacteroidia bacterium]